jgi:hypothetical protein
MICSHCSKDTDVSPLQDRINEARLSLQPSECLTYGLSGRTWWRPTPGVSPGYVIEVTEEELTAIRKGATLEEVMQARQTAGGTQ